MNTLALPDLVSCQILAFLPASTQADEEQIRQQVEAFVTELTPPSMAEALRHMVRSPMLALELGPKNGFPALPEAALMACPPKALAQLEACEVLAVVNVVGPYRAPFYHWHLGQAVARILHQEHGGLIFDLSSMVWPADPGASFKEDIAMGRVVRLQCVPQTAETLRARTLGLAQFGLPELEVHDAPKADIDDINVTMQATAQALLRHCRVDYQEDAPPESLSIPTQFTVEPDDVLTAFALGEEHQDRFAPTHVGLTLVHNACGAEVSSPEAQPVLLMGKPEGTPDAATGWLTTCTQTLLRRDVNQHI